MFTGKNGNIMPYRILIPADYNPEITYPLVLCLHGASGRGIDNKCQCRASKAFLSLSSPDVQKRYPSFLLTPQCPKEKQWVDIPWKKGSYSISEVHVSEQMELVLEILYSIKKEFSIDPARIYVTGQSMGGYGTWDIILRNPDLFAAAVPVCGAGDPAQAERIAFLPIWAFHGDKDKRVPANGSREMYAALKRFGGNIRYTKYPGFGHDALAISWMEEGLIPWLFKQHKPARCKRREIAVPDPERSAATDSK